ncbi:MAG TPA: hypothetical protein VGG35_10855 [Streptosporangiaceae bacterium]
MKDQQLLDLVIGVAVLALLIFRQLRTRPVSGSGMRVALILGVVGLFETVGFAQKHQAGTAMIAALAGSLVLAVLFGALRARTVHVWLKDGTAWMKGNAITAGLWVVALGAHLGYDALLDTHKSTSGLGSATIVLYLAVTLAVQRYLVAQRAARLAPGQGSTPTFGAGTFGGAGR